MITNAAIDKIDKMITVGVDGGINPDSVNAAASALADYANLNKQGDDRVTALHQHATACSAMPNDSDKYDTLCDLIDLANKIALDQRNASNALIVDALSRNLVIDVTDILRTALSNERARNGPYVETHQFVYNAWRDFRAVALDNLTKDR